MSALTDLLGLPKDASRSEITQEAREANAALRSFDDLFPLVVGNGLANYLSNLADAVSEQQTDLDAVVCTLRAVHEALDADPPADDTRFTSPSRGVLHLDQLRREAAMNASDDLASVVSYAHDVHLSTAHPEAEKWDAYIGCDMCHRIARARVRVGLAPAREVGRAVVPIRRDVQP